MKKPIIVTGSGRSGTHWLAGVLSHFMDARHESDELVGDIVVSCRLNQRVQELRGGHRVIHLIRDGRDVVRSQDTAYGGRRPFATTCQVWADIIDGCGDVEAVRLEDLTRPADASGRHLLPHWTEWGTDHTETFWRICGDQMRRHGYER